MSVGLENGGDVSGCEGVVDETQEEGRFANHPVADDNQLVLLALLSLWISCHFADVFFSLLKLVHKCDENRFYKCYRPEDPNSRS